MTNLEYSQVVEELQQYVGKHFSKISLAGSTYRIKIGTASILCELGVRLHLTKYIEKETTLDSFCQKVRRELDNSRLLSVVQVNHDRVIQFEFKAGSLYFEMFGKGNVVLVQEGNTVAAAKREKWADREIKPGAPYKTPKASVVFELNRAISDKYIAASLMKLPFGKPYVLEVLRRAGIDEKIPGNKLSAKQKSSLQGEFDSLNSSLEPICFYEGDAVVDFSLTKLSEYSDAKVRAFPSLSEAADEFYFKKKPPENPELKKLRDRLEKQKERLEKLKLEERECKEKGDFIYANFQEMEQILKTASEKKLSDIEKELERYKVKVNKKEKTIELEL